MTSTTTPPDDQDDHDEHDEHDEHDTHDRGLPFDLSRLLARRRLLGLFAGAGIATLVAACGNDDDSSSATATTPSTSAPGASATAGADTTTAATSPASTAAASTAAESTASCSPIPEETAGPYPGDGSNGPNVLTESGVVRSDITSSFGSSSGVADGVPMTIELTVSDAAGCTPLAGAAVYVWHCDRDGNYSLYSEAAAGENYLRGVQETDADGRVTFTSIFPGCYSGRWPHVHFEVYPSLDEATSAASTTATSQLAFPADACEVVYATDGYEDSVRNLGQLSLETDNVFRDGVSQQLATVTGSVADGYVATLALSV